MLTYPVNTLISKLSVQRKPTSELQRLQAALQQATSFAATYPNNSKLWTMVRIAIDQVLYAEWRAGRLLGMRASEAYFVRCDAATMTQTDITNLRLVAVAGVALYKPAEFEILTVVQQTGA